MAKRTVTKKRLVLNFCSGRNTAVTWSVGEAKFSETAEKMILQRPEGRMTFYPDKLDYWVIETFKEEVKPKSREDLNSTADPDSVFVDD